MRGAGDGLEEELDAGFDGLGAGVECEFGGQRALVRVIDPGKTGDFAGAGFLVQTFGVARFADAQRRIDEDFDEGDGGLAIARVHGADGVAVGLIGRDERGDGDQPRVGKQAADLADAPDVLGAIGGGEAQIGTQAVTEVVAVESVCRAAGLHEVGFERGGDGAFAACGEAGEPNGAAACVEGACAVLA